MGMSSQKKSKSSKLSVQASGSTKKSKSFKPVNAVAHGIDSTNLLRRAWVKAHDRCGHVSRKKLIYFNKTGQGSFVYNSDDKSFGFEGQRLPSLCCHEE